MLYGFQIGDIITGLALLLSTYAVWTTARFNRRQLSLIKTQEELNVLLLEQGKSQAQNSRKAELGASLIKIGSNKHRLRIYNSGKSAARNVQIEFPDGDDLVIGAEVEAKFPMEILESHHSVELVAAVHFGTKWKHKVRLLWVDDASDANEKTVYLTI